MLSLLTGDLRFERAAAQAVKKIWASRSPLDLVGSNLNIHSGQWTQSHASIGGGVDSFYEYLFKSYILFGDPDFGMMATQAYSAVNKHLRQGDW